MGSRMMHYAITVLLQRELGIENELFQLGGIAPDVHKNMNVPKPLSHFLVKEEGRSYPDYAAFQAKYKPDESTPFHLGYYFHLVSDDLWVRRIYHPRIGLLPQPAKKEAQQQSYRDFWRLNGKLADHYGLQWRSSAIDPALIGTIEEIDPLFLPALQEDMSQDFARMEEAKQEELELLGLAEVHDLLVESVQLCLELYSKIRLAEGAGQG
ncbi:hypothetical protein MJA45_12765 [Paenibacillus aurantius]|uniref:Phospholipase C/D domain-containing protein n=1 Tax=Paenibacillus aurantius TaxID=2918900 RepID=A0AA96LIG6_9BACL|nr:hypothetical protein [Paenibacillus aurantius]WNQ13845.1 hypothetical protein MJA45_12765 [Paenibacillus aurantius]